VEQFAGELELSILYRGDPQLLNTYAVMHDAGEPMAPRFAEWLTRGSGRAVVEAFTMHGRRQFHVWPVGCSAARPADEPCVPPGAGPR
jgi:ABC-type tungstate transport system permease subunit